VLDRDAAFEAKQREWLATQFEAIPDELKVLRPSEWAEQRRYLPASVTPLPGPFSFSVAPYTREILDCLSVDSPIREVTWMKGVQICATVGVLENAIGYAIDHVRTAPVMMVTADAELAKLRMESYVTPMLEHSGLLHLIRSSDETNTRKTGKTDRKLEWEGGGFLVPFGAQNANKLRSLSVEWLLNDETDGWPDRVGKDGDPMRLVRDRTAAYEASRKILNISTPNLKGQSKIAERYAQGDQRKYFVCCLSCGFPQVLRWRGETGDGVVYGMQWETTSGVLDVSSVRYVCQNCGHGHVNDDKERLLDPSNGAEWRPTAEPKDPHHRSYHLSALYSPVGMQTWGACVEKWLDAWDVEHNRSRDNYKLQVFYNNVLGEPFELRGERVRLDAVSAHRRPEYRFGELPNAFALKASLGPILCVTAAVDVHADDLAVAVFGWTRGRRAFLLNYWRFEGDTAQISDPGTWVRLAEFIDKHAYVADDGKRYRIALTLIDSGYRTDLVYQFALEYSDGVHPVKGRELPTKAATFREFSEFQTPMGTKAFAVTVDVYKDRWSSALRRDWDGIGIQPAGHFNAPVDVTEAQLKELTVETKVPKPGTGEGYQWRRPPGAANELWDLLVYNSAALDLLAWDVCRNQLELDDVDWAEFWRLCEEEPLYFTR
jgi:phage terminase large subunit GpA-like protein